MRDLVAFFLALTLVSCASFQSFQKDVKTETDAIPYVADTDESLDLVADCKKAKPSYKEECFETATNVIRARVHLRFPYANLQDVQYNYVAHKEKEVRNAYKILFGEELGDKPRKTAITVSELMFYEYLVRTSHINYKSISDYNTSVRDRQLMLNSFNKLTNDIHQQNMREDIREIKYNTSR